MSLATCEGRETFSQKINHLIRINQLHTLEMKRIVFLLSVLTLFCGCKDEVITDYFVITISKPKVIEGTFGYKAEGGKLYINNCQRYESDSAAIAGETQRYEEFDRQMQDSLSKCSDDLKGKVEAEVYADILDETRILMRLTHHEDFNFNELREVIIKEGAYSLKTKEYFDAHQIEVEFYTLKE